MKRRTASTPESRAGWGAGGSIMVAGGCTGGWYERPRGFAAGSARAARPVLQPVHELDSLEHLVHRRRLGVHQPGREPGLLDDLGREVGLGPRRLLPPSHP